MFLLLTSFYRILLFGTSVEDLVQSVTAGFL